MMMAPKNSAMWNGNTIREFFYSAEKIFEYFKYEWTQMVVDHGRRNFFDPLRNGFIQTRNRSLMSWRSTKKWWPSSIMRMTDLGGAHGANHLARVIGLQMTGKRDVTPHTITLYKMTRTRNMRHPSGVIHFEHHQLVDFDNALRICLSNLPIPCFFLGKIVAFVLLLCDNCVKATIFPRKTWTEGMVCQSCPRTSAIVIFPNKARVVFKNRPFRNCKMIRKSTFDKISATRGNWRSDPQHVRGRKQKPFLSSHQVQRREIRKSPRSGWECKM